MRSAVAVALLLAAGPVRAPQPRVTLVACAPGYPGTPAEAQPNMDALAAAAARAAGWPAEALAAVYEPTERDGVARLAEKDAAVALVPLPFLVKHGAALRLEPRLAVVTQGAREPVEVWSLVAKRGRVATPPALAGFTVTSTAGYAPAFVRAALAGWGRLPDDVRIVESSQVLSALRKAASGEPIAVLLDGTQAAALPSLPFANDLEVIARSAPLPSGVVVTVGDRLPAARWRALEKAFLALPGVPEGAAALQGLRMERLAPLDAAAREAIRSLGSGAAR
ncbi:substrate-binding domain-containing protein [Anaeromyxobacter oryzae]|uniref:Phosphate/phosphite/phosphonate ABC transporter substrate-binding protein n=1 Tax=Anaeromyxobacter oryzae TaxID=2918170 RepID=A0ABN6MMP4_9BACT|nr:hypothetical protein [Anaeromyxobacter oryzae]BDG02231.1 hypothetical protein AMOR_12270 [Anaeromyxobacter oryzae]